jgi:hypothetical protein
MSRIEKVDLQEEASIVRREKEYWWKSGGKVVVLESERPLKEGEKDDDRIESEYKRNRTLGPTMIGNLSLPDVSAYEFRSHYICFPILNDSRIIRQDRTTTIIIYSNTIRYQTLPLRIRFCHSKWRKIWETKMISEIHNAPSFRFLIKFIH